MNRRQLLSRALALAAVPLAGALVAAVPAVVIFGPPWISIEYPVNPHDRTTRGAFLLVHAFQHGTEMNFPVTGTAEGIVDGKRQTVELKFESTSRTGVFALRKQWATEGTWLIAVTVHQSLGDDGATALVEISPAGEVASVRVPVERRDGWSIPKRVTKQDREAALTALATRSRAELARGTR